MNSEDQDLNQGQGVEGAQQSGGAQQQPANSAAQEMAETINANEPVKPVEADAEAVETEEAPAPVVQETTRTVDHNGKTIA